MLHVEVIVYCRWFGHIPALVYLHMFDSLEVKRRVRFRNGKCCMCGVIFCWLKFGHILAWVVLASVNAGLGMLFTPHLGAGVVEVSVSLLIPVYSLNGYSLMAVVFRVQVVDSLEFKSNV